MQPSAGRAMRMAEESAALLAIGDGVAAALMPRRHVMLWNAGPHWWRDLMRMTARHPLAVRLAGVTEAALGLWFASRATR